MAKGSRGGKVGNSNNLSHSDRIKNDYGDLFKGRENTELYPEELKAKYNLTEAEENDFLNYQKRQTAQIIRAGLGEYNYGGTNYNLEKTSESYLPKGAIEEKRKRERALKMAQLHYDGKIFNELYLQAWRIKNKK